MMGDSRIIKFLKAHDGICSCCGNNIIANNTEFDISIMFVQNNLEAKTRQLTVFLYVDSLVI